MAIRLATIRLLDIFVVQNFKFLQVLDYRFALVYKLQVVRMFFWITSYWITGRPDVVRIFSGLQLSGLPTVRIVLDYKQLLQPRRSHFRSYKPVFYP